MPTRLRSSVPAPAPPAGPGRRAAAALLLLALAAGPAAGGQLAYWQPGQQGLRETLVPPRGVHVSLQQSLYTARLVRDERGGRLSDVIVDLPVVGPTQLSLRVELEVTRITPVVAVVPLDLEAGPLGLRLGAFVAPSLSDGSINTSLTTLGYVARRLQSESSLDIGDTYLVPAWLGLRLGRLSLSASYGLVVATARRSAEGQVTRGSGFDSQVLQVTAALSVDPHQLGALVVRATYELPGRQQDTRIEPGERVTVEAGLAQGLVEYEGVVLGLGIHVGHQRQVKRDAGRAYRRGIPRPGRDEVWAIAGEVSASYLPWGLVATAPIAWEFEAEGRFEGLRLGLNVTLPLPLLHKPRPRRQ